MDFYKTIGDCNGNQVSRTAAIRTINEYFTTFAIKGSVVDRDRWPQLFQAVHTVIAKEKATYLKKHSSAALNMLVGAGECYKMLVEKSATLHNSSTVNTVKGHIRSNLIHRGNLFEPLALPMLKSLRALFQHHPHVAHLKVLDWEMYVSECFNIILEYPIHTPLESMDGDADMDNDTEGEDVRMSDTTANGTPSLGKRKHAGTQIISKRVKHNLKSASSAQVEASAILPLLMSSLTHTLTDDIDVSQSPVPKGLLRRIGLCLESFSSDSTLYADFLNVLSSVLDHLSLSKAIVVNQFAQDTWDDIIEILKTKNKHIKEVLVCVLHKLLPFRAAHVTLNTRMSVEWARGVYKLWELLQNDAINRWGESLSLDALRFEFSEETDAFKLHVCQAGVQFESGHALSWSLLELQADCTEMLFSFFESPQCSNTRSKSIYDPIESLLTSIRNNRSSSRTCIHHLQVMLFFIDRHWNCLYAERQKYVIDVLLDLVSNDNPLIQSWSFLCFASISSSDRLASISGSSPASKRDSTVWDPIWTHALRRANVPNVGRSACHAADSLLLYHIMHSAIPHRSISIVNSNRVLSEIETFTRDLDVQGPAYPYDSVCTFLTHCLGVAAQDVRLYRMQLEEKVLQWLSSSWSLPVDGEPARVGIHDILTLLEVISGFTQRSHLSFKILLPDTLVVTTALEERRTKVIRDWILDAKLPPYQANHIATSNVQSEKPFKQRSKSGLLEPSGRERRISAFLLRRLESHVSEWGSSGSILRPRAERARGYLNSAVIALSFEALLKLNGVRSNVQVAQAGYQMIILVCDLLASSLWSAKEKVQVLLALESLVSTGPVLDQSSWTAMANPDSGTGITTEALRSLVSKEDSLRAKNVRTRQVQFQGTVWNLLDANVKGSNVLETVKTVMRTLLRQLLCVEQVVDVDKDGFGDTRVSDQPSGGSRDEMVIRHLAHICIDFLTITPVLSFGGQELPRNKEILELLNESIDTCPDNFLTICPDFFRRIQFGTLRLSYSSLSSFMDEFSILLRNYNYSHSPLLQRLVVVLLHSTLPLWVNIPVATDNDLKDVANKADQLFGWLTKILQKKSAHAWPVRDASVSLINDMMVMKPSETGWFNHRNREDDLPILPTLLISLLRDKDIRVRFRAVFVHTDLFRIAGKQTGLCVHVYNSIRDLLAIELENYEHMATRILGLANIAVASAVTRRGAYWHLVESCLYTDRYDPHLSVALTEVAHRMGLKSRSLLFEIYASQTAYSIMSSGKDVLQMSPRVLGYESLTECAKAAFSRFAPTAIISDIKSISFEDRFRNLCDTIKVSVETGILECFGDIIAQQTLLFFRNCVQLDDLDALLAYRSFCHDDAGFTYMLRENIDAVIASTIRTITDFDVSPSGPIIAVLRKLNPDMANTFCALTIHRPIPSEEEQSHNLPAYPSDEIILALEWYKKKAGEEYMNKAVYHVLQELFATLHATPLLSERLRLVNAICLWVAYNFSMFSTRALLYTLANGAGSILGDLDLASSAQSIMDWTFECYIRLDRPDTRFPNLLIHACYSVHALSQDDDNDICSLGQGMTIWINAQAVLMSKKPKLKDQVIRSLAGWPLEKPAGLEDIDLSDLISALNDPRMTSNKFRLVRQLSESPLYTTGFSGRDFWRLKECIPSARSMSVEDMTAFAKLLVMHKGSIHSFGKEQLRDGTLDNSHRKYEMKPQAVVVSSLIFSLSEQVPARLYSAYCTLRAIMATSGELICSYHWSSEEKATLRCFPHSCSRYLIRRSVQTLGRLKEPHFLSVTADFPTWITDFCILLSDVLAANDPFYGQLRPMLLSDIRFCESVLPTLVQVILQAPQASEYSEVLNGYLASVLSTKHSVIPCLRSIIDIVLHLRNLRKQSRDDLGYNRWLTLDFTSLAQTSIICGRYTTALLFLELASDNPSQHGEVSTEQIFYEIYGNIDEPDGFYGIADSNHHQFLVKRFHHERQWEKAFHFHGAAFEAQTDDSGEAEGLMMAFHSFGFNHLASNACQNVPSAPSATSVSYHLGWRTEAWDLPDKSDERQSGHALYLALRGVHRDRDSSTVDQTLQRAFAEEIVHISAIGPENIKEIRETVQSLMCLSQVNQWRGNLSLDGLQHLTAIDDGFDFSDLESIMATRISLIRAARREEERQQIGNMVSPLSRTLLDLESQCLLRISREARKAQQVQIALNSVVRAEKLHAQAPFSVSEEYANVLWVHNEPRSVQLLSSLLHHADNLNAQDLAQVNARLGAWTAEACLEKPSNILERYFKPASAAISLNGPNSSHAHIYHQFATFAERQYKSNVTNADIARRKVYIERKSKDINTLSTLAYQGRQNPADGDVSRLIIRFKKQLAEDVAILNQYISERDEYLQLAIKMYSRCLQVSDEYDNEASIHLCSLWLANFDSDFKLVAADIDHIPSHKFIFLAHQLSARLSEKKSDGQRHLRKLIMRMCIEHPFHSLYQLYSLTSNDKNGPTSQSTSRATVARELLNRLQGDAVKGVLVRIIEDLATACLTWARYSAKRDSVKAAPQYPIPNKFKIKREENLPVPVMTCHTPLDLTMEYSNCIWITKYDDFYKTAGGINLPKITVCHGSDGQGYKQLFKDEDLRQDAVMEQVFELVNTMLARDPETKKRNLIVRDYKVIPLASDQGAGLLEFVDNTEPLGGWLHEAHPRYRPTDLSVKAVRAQFQKFKELTKGERLAGWEKLTNVFQPVMRHFFTEKHKNPVAWFAMRLCYTRSVASNSIVGHILGLGDRHTSNILVDRKTGELVHIDLGIAFEQGKLLNVPETVPFRMTRDMVDGMGISGTEGVFQRCAEETMRVLRGRSELIMSVLEVFRHDPLYSWTASESKIKRAQEDTTTASDDAVMTALGLGIGVTRSSGTAEEAADRALSTVARKLDKTLSASSAVSGLIAEARDPNNLSSLFAGWAPYL